MLLRRPASPQIRSLAVLPLANLSGDPGQDYFAEGMTDALITKLAGIQSLRVISRQSVMQYQKSRKPLPEIARELAVDGVVEGSVLQEGGRVRVTAQLLHAPTDRHLWARSYDRGVGDLLGLQTELAEAIAEEMRARVTAQRAPASLRRAKRAYAERLRPSTCSRRRPCCSTCGATRGSRTCCGA